ncbi:hypothetical protein L7F22_039991 [Adiantum nelumboides]|nr:hypothetical protein [Adiantum nelumboides]
MTSSEGLAKRARDPLDRLADDDYSKDRKPPAPKHVKGLRTLLLAVGIPLVLGSIDAFFNSPNQPFYAELRKPFWNPPGWLFGFAWSLLYPTMGLASWLVWTQGGWMRQKPALSLYVLQLTLNLLWPYLFFGRHDIKLALIDIAVLVVVLAACVNAFSKANHVAGNLMKPYLAWVIFATALNYALWTMNKGVQEPLVPAKIPGQMEVEQ